MNTLIVALDDPTTIDVADGEVLVVAPALNSRLRHWLSDDDAALAHAEERVSAWLEQLSGHAARVRGRVGDADPLQAIADELPWFEAHEILVVGGSAHSDNLADELIRRAGSRFGLPLKHADRTLAHAA